MNEKYKLKDILIEYYDYIEYIDELYESWCIFGGAALNFYNEKRTIRDVDLLLSNFKSEEPNTELLPNIIDMWPTPFIFPENEFLRMFIDEEMKQHFTFLVLCDITIPILSVEDNIVMKVLLDRGKESNKRDRQDVLDFYNSLNEKLDISYLNYRVETIGGRKEVVIKKLNEIGVFI